MKSLVSLALALTVVPMTYAVGTTAVSTPPPPGDPAALPLAGTPAAAAPAPPELVARVDDLTAEARAHSVRLGLAPAPAPAPAAAAGAAEPVRTDVMERREERLAAVVAFLAERTEADTAVDERPAHPVPAAGRGLQARVDRAHALAVARAVRLGVDRPAPLPEATTRSERVAQLARWRTVASWLGARRERVRPHERPLSARIPHYDELMCIAEHESHGTWDINTGNGYYGGLQMDRTFQQTYSPGLYARKGTADNWTQEEQMRTAEKAIVGRGFSPWPNTARMCGLL
ncbi:MAG: transglycosylase family protein [Thermoleophilia bacterium]